MKDISIEYAHIYTNKKIGEEQKLSLTVLRDLVKEHSGKNISFVLMVDDYSFPDPSFGYGGLKDWLNENGFKPDIMIRESQLIPSCDEVIHLIEDKKLREQIGDYIRSKKYPCSLFVATWYLIRLGYIESNLIQKEFIAKELINILPRSFEPFENAAFEILRATRFRNAVDHISNRYFEGRLIA
ncbi:MAG: hypothetical protein MUD00_02790 [Candidatus Pacebacteria bacterium]|jgi:hypothetical protein|nr:hypothetical protein [Candidatus Paceibacterota bacterium]